MTLFQALLGNVGTCRTQDFKLGSHAWILLQKPQSLLYDPPECCISEAKSFFLRVSFFDCIERFFGQLRIDLILKAPHENREKREGK